jgi:tryptophan 2,3-dioxygenase
VCSLGALTYYHDYLHLDELLATQEPLTEAHDELLFIIVHQAYELWFRQVIHELEAVHEILSGDVVPESAMLRLVGHLERVISIQRIMTAQLETLETMTPLDFMDFRDRLVPASGFQSVQWRLIENLLGIPVEVRLPIDGKAYTSRLSPDHADTVGASEDRPSIFDLVEAWLERTPFLETPDFAFWDAYRSAVDDLAAREVHLIEDNPNLTADARAAQLARADGNRARFAALFDDDLYAAEQAAGAMRMSRRAFLAAVMINLYRDEPIVQVPFQMLTALVDLDEGFTTWRYGHALMARRMIGGRIGTGGTSGAEYLTEAARRYRVWGDLLDMATYLVPRHAIPPLPDDLRDAMGFG